MFSKEALTPPGIVDAFHAFLNEINAAQYGVDYHGSKATCSAKGVK